MTRFRPCIDLHDGKVKQIIGSTLTDDINAPMPVSSPPPLSLPLKSDTATGNLTTNFATDKPSTDFAALYRKDGLLGGHVIMLGPGNETAATAALEAWPGHLQVGGGINAANCQDWLQRGASHVIVTSYVFQDGHIRLDRLDQLTQLVGRNRLVLDLSCRRHPGADPSSEPYYVVTDRWQRFTETPVTPETLDQLAKYCDEFLVHGVDVEGKQCGILEDLVQLLGNHSPIPVTYAGGVRSLDDLDLVDRLGKGKVDVTVGSALDIFGGSLSYDGVVEWHKNKNPTS